MRFEEEQSNKHYGGSLKRLPRLIAEKVYNNVDIILKEVQ